MTMALPSADSAPSVCICICTMDRPGALRACLQSIVAGEVTPQQVIVSDDSPLPHGTQEVCAAFPFVEYMEGPHRGLCANRNRVIAAARTTHVSLLDDDATVGKDFVRRALDHAQHDDDHAIITGDVLDGGQVFRPGAPDFWGRFLPTPRNGRYETLQLNCNLFPLQAFQTAHFDELIDYGFEDMDLCSALLAAGYRILYDPEMQNQHFPPPQDERTARNRFGRWEQARYYTSLKRYFIWQRSPLLGFFYAAAAPLYTALFSARWRKWHRIPKAPGDMLKALRVFQQFRRASGRTVAKRLSL